MIRGIGGLTVYSRIILWVQPPVKELPTFPFLGFYSHNVTARHGIKKEAPSCAWRKNTSLISSSSITFSCYLQKGAARSVPRLQPHGRSQRLQRRRATMREKHLTDGTLRRQEPFHRECFYVTGTRLSYLHKRLLLSSSW